MSPSPHPHQQRAANTPRTRRERASERGRLHHRLWNQLIDKVRWNRFMRQLNSEIEKDRVSESERAHTQAHTLKPICKRLFRYWVFDYQVYKWNLWLKKNNPQMFCGRGRGGCLVFDLKDRDI